MDERDQSLSAGGHELASEVGERVRTIISAAEAAANAVRHEAEQEAAVRRRVAEEEARRIIEDAKADADAHLAERIRRISELSDTVVERAETIVARLDRAEEVRKQLQALADSLGESAERLASEVRVGAPPPTVRTPPASTSPPPAAPATAVGPERRDEPAGAAPAPPAEEVAPPAAEAGGAPTAPPPVVTPPSVPEASAPPVAEPPSAPEVSARPPAEPFPRAPEPPPADVAAQPGTGASDVVGLERREPPAPDTTAPSERRDAEQQLGARLVALQMAVAGGNRGEVEVHLRRTFQLTDSSPILDDIFGQGTDASKRVAWPRTGDGAA